MKNLDWQEKLLEQVVLREKVKFEWGKHDCCLFAADVVQAMTGVDYASEFRGKYSTEIGAKRLLAKAGEDGLTGVLDGKFAQVDLSYVQRGDLVLVQTDAGPALGIYWAGQSVWLQGLEGVQLFINIKDRILKAWRV
ncbi:hypothetical protein QJV44_gp18 [Serratia phage vB_SmaS_Tlacuache]|uniref:DUF6950 domain-containing protein n=1 Tax=Serratia phage vB_SmaS_Tlacuache TaxID=2894809 RepID=A0AAE8YYY1_9CAUD|nr:hypothetical protein QJV44_gp18 [Serratia phage vB_SmaS_Tlacuache]UGO51432.1 hypothetical protein TLACUACHE_18 [Serratia phage vB_SmaS_Tlacuache]